MPKIGPRKFNGGSVGDLSSHEAIADIGGLDPGELADPGKDHNPGRGIYRKQLEAFAQLTDNEKLDALRETWKEVAMGAAVRAKTFVATCSPKDFGGLHKLISAAAVGIEQAFPRKQEAASQQFIINMFGSLGQRAAAIAAPPIPIITVDAKEVSWPSSNLTSGTVSSLPMKMET